jgi:hypothetical protein
MQVAGESDLRHEAKRPPDSIRAAAALLVALVCFAPTKGCSTTHPEPVQVSSPNDRQVESAMQNWFGTLADADLSRGELGALLRTGDLRFDLVDGAHWNDETLRDWVTELRSEHPHVRYSIARFHVDGPRDGSYRAHFEVDREAVDEQGMHHLMRREQSWQLRPADGSRLRVLDIDDEPILAFPGSGPQIVCY